MGGSGSSNRGGDVRSVSALHDHGSNLGPNLETSGFGLVAFDEERRHRIGVVGFPNGDDGGVWLLLGWEDDGGSDGWHGPGRYGQGVTRTPPWGTQPVGSNERHYSCVKNRTTLRWWVVRSLKTGIAVGRRHRVTGFLQPTPSALVFMNIY